MKLCRCTMAANSMISLLLLSLTLLSVAVTTKVTPMEKVIELMTNLKKEVEDEGKAEATTYNTFACFCKDKTGSYSDSILAGKDSINVYSSDVSLKTASQKEANENLVAAKKKEDQLNKDLEAVSQECATGLAAFQASDADLTKAISSLNGAIATMENSKPTGGAAAAAGFITVRTTLKNTMMLADAMKILDSEPHWGRAVSLLEESSTVNPSDPGAKFHSQGIIKLMQDILDTFTSKKEDADAKEATRSQACTDKVTDHNTQLQLTASEILGYEEQIGTLTTEIANARASLVESESVMQNDQMLLKDLTEECEARAKDYDQRSQMRAGELAALTAALKVLGDAPEEAKRFLLQVERRDGMAGEAVSAPVFFLQTAEVSEHRQQDEAMSQEQARARRKSHALELLRSAGARLGSTALIMTASRAELMSGPFEKIKGLIEKLIQRLVKEATEEATKKGYCDTNLAKAESDRDYRYQDVMTLNTEIEVLENKKDQLELDISDLSAAVNQLTTDLETATTCRANEKADNLATIHTDKEGAAALKQAMNIINSFYKEAAKAASFAQQPAVGNYGGQQDAIKGIMGLLEVIKSDFEKEMEETQAAEKKAAADFVLYDRDAKADIAAKTTKKELNTQDLATTDSNIKTKMDEMQKNMELVDAALSQLESLKSMCVDTGMSYAERVAKREAEIAHLKTALCILDEQKVEEQCQSS